MDDSKRKYMSYDSKKIVLNQVKSKDLLILDSKFDVLKNKILIGEEETND